MCFAGRGWGWFLERVGEQHGKGDLASGERSGAYPTTARDGMCLYGTLRSTRGYMDESIQRPIRVD